MENFRNSAPEFRTPTNGAHGASFDIYIVGSGIKWVEQITLETDRVLSECNEILYVEKAPGIESYFYSKCSKVTDLTTFYGEDKHREITYREMAAKVVESALQNPPVAFSVYGHPTIYAYPPFLVREMASHLGLSVKIMPGISALDCLLADLAIDPSVNGIQMYEATDLLLRRHPIAPTTATILWQVGSISTALYSTGESMPERFFAFRDYLLQYYPASHCVYSYFANPHPMLKPEIYKFPIADLPSFAPVLHAAVTLYIPPAETLEVCDMTVASSLNDPNYLRQVTQTVV